MFENEKPISDIEKRLRLFVEHSDCNDTNAQVIRDTWLNGDISLETANEISSCVGIAGPLGYWKHHNLLFQGRVKLSEGYTKKRL